MQLSLASWWPDNRRRYAVSVLIALAYALVAWGSLRFATVQANVSPVWPPSGLAMAALIGGGLRCWPGVWAGALLANYLLTPVSLPAALLIASGNSAEALFGVAVSARYLDDQAPFHSLRHTLAFTVAAVILAPCLSAAAGLLALTIDRALPANAMATVATTWWLGDASGAILVTPLLIALPQIQRWRWPWRDWLHVGALALLNLLVAATIYLDIVPQLPARQTLIFITPPLLLWLALRGGQFAAFAVLTASAVMAIVGTTHQLGPFGQMPLNTALLMLQTFMAVHAIIALLILAAHSERLADGRRLRGEYLQKTAALAKSESLFRTLASTVPIGIYLTDPQGKCTFTNDRWCDMAGLSATQALGDGWIAAIAEEDRSVVYTNWQRMVDARGLWGHEYRFRTPQGDVTWVFGVASELHDANGQLLGYVGANLDVTARRHAEQELRHVNAELETRVEQRTAQLRDSLRDVEAYSYTVSHDLRAPLRAIHFVVAALLEDKGDSLDADIRQTLQRINGNANTMQTMIEHLLEFSRLGRQALQWQTISAAQMQEMIRSVWDDIRVDQSSHAIQFDLKLNQACGGDPTLLRQVFQNLLSNACKFTRPNEAPRIEIGVCDSDYGKAIYVRDNGIGFDMQYADKLFRLFSRLHSRNDFEGHGIGLAMVERIVRLHGGAIWVESQPGQGTVFYLCLPLEQPPVMAIS